MSHEPPNPIILYDGVCGLCNRLVQFILKRDPRDLFRFAALQSGFAAPILRRHGASPEDFDTMYVVLDHGESSERLLARSDAAVHVLRQLSWAWRMVAVLLRAVPRPVREWGYRMVARYRYRIFGKYDTCPLPDSKSRSKFLDGQATGC